MSRQPEYGPIQAQNQGLFILFVVAFYVTDNAFWRVWVFGFFPYNLANLAAPHFGDFRPELVPIVFTIDRLFAHPA